MNVHILVVLMVLANAYGREMCGDYICPAFDVVYKTKNYEKRCYPSYNWVATHVTVKFVKPFQKIDNRIKDETFIPLRNYRLGANQDTVKFNQTVPVIKEYAFIRHDDTTDLKLTRFFFLPPFLQNKPPKPTDPNVHIVSWKRTCFYVRQYKGPTAWNKVKQQVKILRKALTKDGRKDFQSPTQQFFYAGYEIGKVRKHNEIWFTIKGNWKVASLSLLQDEPKNRN